ncbi:hypothetical protein IAT38_006480 [Cryptococcus sp. DSM 104549]
MPTATVLPALAPQAPQAWTKPTLANTHGGKTYKPTHPELFRVEFTAMNGLEEGFASRLLAVRDYAPGEVITKLTNICLAPEKAYSSVQFGSGPRDHLELNSDLLFMNHSCSPTVEVHLPPSRPDNWHIRAAADGPGIKRGEAMTFFYPSTEWDMAQGFECACGSEQCLGKVTGAKYISLQDLQKRSYINEHIEALKAEQAAEEAA